MLTQPVVHIHLYSIPGNPTKLRMDFNITFTDNFGDGSNSSQSFNAGTFTVKILFKPAHIIEVIFKGQVEKHKR